MGKVTDNIDGADYSNIYNVGDRVYKWAALELPGNDMWRIDVCLTRPDGPYGLHYDCCTNEDGFKDIVKVLVDMIEDKTIKEAVVNA